MEKAEPVDAAKVLSENISSRASALYALLDANIKRGKNTAEADINWIERMLYSCWSPLTTVNLADFIYCCYLMEKSAQHAIKLLVDKNRSKESIDETRAVRKDAIAFMKDRLEIYQDHMAKAMSVMIMLREMHDRTTNPLSKIERRFVADAYCIMKNAILPGMVTIKDGPTNEHWGKSIQVPSPYSMEKVRSMFKIDASNMTISQVVLGVQIACECHASYPRMHSLYTCIVELTQSGSEDEIRETNSIRDTFNGCFRPVIEKDERAYVFSQRESRGSGMIEDHVYEVVVNASQIVGKENEEGRAKHKEMIEKAVAEGSMEEIPKFVPVNVRDRITVKIFEAFDSDIGLLSMTMPKNNDDDDEKLVPTVSTSEYVKK